jgi:hemerythrin-like domain-containing protein
MKITEALLVEHIVFHNLFDHVEQAAPGLKSTAEVRALAHLLESVLRAHSETEEKLVFSPLLHCLAQMGQTESFDKEHQEIDVQLIQAKHAKNVAQARRLLLEAVVSSRKHFDKEERLVFPLAESCLKDKTLTDLGRAWMQRREAVEHG